MFWCKRVRESLPHHLRRHTHVAFEKLRLAEMFLHETCSTTRSALKYGLIISSLIRPLKKHVFEDAKQTRLRWAAGSR